jgi:hypothetical protein
MSSDQFEDRLRQLQNWTQDRLNVLNNKAIEDSLNLLIPENALRRVGFIGRRGTGKSTLINRLIGHALLPSASNYAASAALTEVSAWPKSKDDTFSRIDYYVCVYFIEANEWILLVNDAMKEVSDWRKTESGLYLGDARSDLPKLNVLWESLHAFQEEFKDEIDQFLCPDGDTLFFEKFLLQQGDPLLLLPRDLRQLVDKKYLPFFSRESSSIRPFTKPYNLHEKSRWPIVQKITIRGPFELLGKEGFSLLDIPGEGDGDPILHQHFEAGISMCDQLYYLPENGQVSSAHTVNQIIRFWGEGPGVHLAMVITKAANSETEEEMPWIPLARGTELIKKQLLYHVGAHAQNSIRYKIINDLPLYFVENDPKSDRGAVCRRYDEHWDNFLNCLVSPIRTQAKQSLCNYINDINNAFSIIRIGMQATKEQRLILLGSLSQKFETCFTGGRLGCDGFLDKDKIRAIFNVRVSFPQAIPWINSGIHFKTLKALFNPSSLELANNLLQSLIFQPDLETVACTNVTEICTKVRGLVLNELQSLAGSLEVLVSNTVRELAIPQFNMNALWFALLNSVHRQYHQEWIMQLKSGNKMRDNTILSMQLWFQQNKISLSVFVVEEAARFLLGIVHEFIRQMSWSFTRTITTLKNTVELDTQSVLNEIPSTLITFDAVTSGAFFQATSQLSGNFYYAQPNNPLIGPSPSLERLKGLLSDAIKAASVPLQNPFESVDASTLNRLCSLRKKDCGSVYVLSNPSFKDNRYKIGLTTRSCDKRAKELYTTGVPTPFQVKHQWEVVDTKLMERFMHVIFEPLRANKSREFFDAPLDVIIRIGNIARDVVQCATNGST